MILTILEYIYFSFFTRSEMRQKTTSLDIQSGKGSILDIAQIFPMTSTRTLDLARHGKFIDGVLK